MSKPTLHNVVVGVTAAIALVLVNLSVWEKEQLLADGRIVLLELAPVDPRSLMQGDYMALRFRVADAALPLIRQRGLIDGTLVVSVDSRSVGTFERLDDDRSLASNEVRLRYRLRGDRLKFATNAFFFEEGTADRYSNARFGELRVADDGELLLTGLRGPELQALGGSGR